MLDGMPLAIELAAARVRALSIEQIAVRLADRFQLLATGDRTAPPRQQTLRAAVDWSYELLTEPEQILLRRLSVFAGWNLEMAEEVCADEAIPAEAILDLLVALIDKSLVTLDTELDGHARYRLLDTIKEYAADRLAASGERPAIRQRHSAYLLRLLEDTVARAFVRGDPPWPERVAMYRRITVERPNYRAALAACLERGDVQEGLRLCCALRSQWVADGTVREGSGWFDRFLGLDGEVSPIVRARALMLRAELAFEQQDYAGAGECAQAGLDLCRAAGGTETAGGLRMLALVSLRAGRPDEALATGGRGGRGRAGRSGRLGRGHHAQHQGRGPGPPGPAGRRPAHLRGGHRRAGRQQRLGAGADLVRPGQPGQGAWRLCRGRGSFLQRAGQIPADRRQARDRPLPGRHRPGWRWPSRTSAWPPPAWPNAFSSAWPPVSGWLSRAASRLLRCSPRCATSPPGPPGSKGPRSRCSRPLAMRRPHRPGPAPTSSSKRRAAGWARPRSPSCSPKAPR